jgi:predicted HD phosphohydrolase
MAQTVNETIDEVFDLSQRSGSEGYFREAVSKIEHSEQCAWLAILPSWDHRGRSS